MAAVEHFLGNPFKKVCAAAEILLLNFFLVSDLKLTEVWALIINLEY